MTAMRLPPRNHPKAVVTCPPLRWSAVGRPAVKAVALALASGGGLAALLLYAGQVRPTLAVGASVVLLGGVAASILWLAHAANAARQPVHFKVARGERTVSWPFLLTRRTRTVRTSDVTAVVVDVPATMRGNGKATGRLMIRRRHRRAIHVPGARPVPELNRAAEELRAALHV